MQPQLQFTYIFSRLCSVPYPNTDEDAVEPVGLAVYPINATKLAAAGPSRDNQSQL